MADIRYISEMDVLMSAGIVMLIVWGALTVGTDAPGAVHLLLTAGVFLTVWRIVVRGTPSGPTHDSDTRNRKR